jgi:hypothetical protein
MSVTNPHDTEDAEDHEIFDINDFTTASDWERFVVQIEELINEWKLNSNVSDSIVGDKDVMKRQKHTYCRFLNNKCIFSGQF